MKKAFFACLMACVLLLSSCSAGPKQEEARLTVAATTWPVYCFASAVAEGAESVRVLPVVNQPMSCLHDYTLTVTDMKALDRADLILKNGVGLENFMDDALLAANTRVVDCSEGVELRAMEGHHHHGEEEVHDDHDHDHDHEEEEHHHHHHHHDHGEFDPHIWLDPLRAARMTENIARAMAEEDPEQAELYLANARTVREELAALVERGREQLSGLSTRELVTFHDGFGYFAECFDLHILKSIEEEEGSEASAHEFRELTAMVREHHLPAVFTEVNGSDATARALHRETGVAIATLTTGMSGEVGGLESYMAAIEHNVESITEALA